MPKEPKPQYDVPEHLSPDMAAFWQKTCDFFWLEPDDVHVLTLACEAYDRGERARQVLEKEGFTFTDRFGQPKSRPECAVVRDAALVFSRLLRQLKLKSLPAAGEEDPLAKFGITGGSPPRRNYGIG